MNPTSRPDGETLADYSGGKLSIKMGSVSRMSQSGVLMYDDGFDDGMNAWVNNAGGGAGITFRLDANQPFSSGADLQVSPGTNTAYEATLGKSIPGPTTNKLGLEFMMNWEYDGVNPVALVDAKIQRSDGINLYEYDIEIDPNLGEIFTYNPSTGLYVPVMTGLQRLCQINTPYYLWFKFTADLVNKYVDTIYFNDLSQQVRSYGPMVTTPAPPYPSMYGIRFWFHGTASNQYVHLDNVVFTRDEP